MFFYGKIQRVKKTFLKKKIDFPFPTEFLLKLLPPRVLCFSLRYHHCHCAEATEGKAFQTKVPCLQKPRVFCVCVCVFFFNQQLLRKAATGICHNNGQNECACFHLSTTVSGTTLQFYVLLFPRSSRLNILDRVSKIQ